MISPAQKNLDGKVALITGANRGIGAGCALELARAGADVAINYRKHQEEAGGIAAKVRALGRRAIVIQGNVADQPANEQMVQRTVAELGRLDVFIANAAYSIRKPFLELSEDDVRQTLGVSLLGVFFGSQAAARQMVAQGHGGSIVVISSVHAAIPFRNSIAYNAAKAGINHMAMTMAAEMTPHRIRVNVIEPGWIDTPGERRWTSEEEIQAAGKRLPWNRLGTIEEIGKAAAFLASDEASYVSGANLRVDGALVVSLQ